MLYTDHFISSAFSFPWFLGNRKTLSHGTLQCHLIDRWINGKSLIIMGDLYIKTAYSNTWAPCPQVRASLVAQRAKNLSANAGDVGSIPGSGRSPGEGNDYPSTILAWKIPWTEEPGGLQSMGSQRVGHDCTTEPAWECIFIRTCMSVSQNSFEKANII